MENFHWLRGPLPLRQPIFSSRAHFAFKRRLLRLKNQVAFILSGTSIPVVLSNLPVLQFSFRLLVGDQIQQILSPGLHFLHKVDQGHRTIQQLWLPAKYETKIIRLWETAHLSLPRS